MCASKSSRRQDEFAALSRRTVHQAPNFFSLTLRFALLRNPCTDFPFPRPATLTAFSLISLKRFSLECNHPGWVTEATDNERRETTALVI